MNNRPRWLDKFEMLLLGATALISGLVALLDFIGVLNEVPWLSERIPTLTLLAMGLIAGYLVIERRGYLEKLETTSNKKIDHLEEELERSVKTIVNSLEGVEIRVFDTGNEMMSYTVKRMSQAKQRIDDLSWSPVISLRGGLDMSRKINQKYAEQVTKASTRLLYREIFIFNRPGRIEKLKQRLDEKAAGYSCAYYKSNNIPVIQFMIIDEEEVIFLSDESPKQLAIRHKEIAKLFSKYYDEIWKNAIPLKLEKTIFQEEVEKVLNYSQPKPITMRYATVYGPIHTGSGDINIREVLEGEVGEGVVGGDGGGVAGAGVEFVFRDELVGDGNEGGG